MADITIIYSTNMEDDGYDGVIQISRSAVDDLTELMWFYSEATNALGFNYVTSIGCIKNDNSEVWSPF